jgi:hypothetical protein
VATLGGSRVKARRNINNSSLTSLLCASIRGERTDSSLSASLVIENTTANSRVKNGFSDSSNAASIRTGVTVRSTVIVRLRKLNDDRSSYQRQAVVIVGIIAESA